MNKKTPMNIHITSKAVRVTVKNVALAGQDAAPAPRRKTEFVSSVSALTALLDKTIGLLMIGIALTLAWPVGLAVWGQSHAAREASRVCQSVPDASTMSGYSTPCIQMVRAV